jgi:hypothetical protein
LRPYLYGIGGGLIEAASHCERCRKVPVHSIKASRHEPYGATCGDRSGHTNIDRVQQDTWGRILVDRDHEAAITLNRLLAQV